MIFIKHLGLENTKQIGRIIVDPKAVHEITGAVKLNYEIHGNTIPHLHLHLFRRYIGDPFESQQINLGSSRIRFTYLENLQSLLKGRVCSTE